MTSKHKSHVIMTMAFYLLLIELAPKMFNLTFLFTGSKIALAVSLSLVALLFLVSLFLLFCYVQKRLKVLIKLFCLICFSSLQLISLQFRQRLFLTLYLRVAILQCSISIILVVMVIKSMRISNYK